MLSNKVFENRGFGLLLVLCFVIALIVFRGTFLSCRSCLFIATKIKLLFVCEDDAIHRLLEIR